MKARVTVYPRPEVLDPQGQAIQKALHRVGFDPVREVRAGRSFDVTLEMSDQGEARELLGRMCEKLLAQTVVEEYEIEFLPQGRRQENTEGTPA